MSVLFSFFSSSLICWPCCWDQCLDARITRVCHYPRQTPCMVLNTSTSRHNLFPWSLSSSVIRGFLEGGRCVSCNLAVYSWLPSCSGVYSWHHRRQSPCSWVTDIATCPSTLVNTRLNECTCLVFCLYNRIDILLSFNRCVSSSPTVSANSVYKTSRRHCDRCSTSGVYPWPPSLRVYPWPWRALIILFLDDQRSVTLRAFIRHFVNHSASNCGAKGLDCSILGPLDPWFESSPCPVPSVSNSQQLISNSCHLLEIATQRMNKIE